MDVAKRKYDIGHYKNIYVQKGSGANDNLARPERFYYVIPPSAFHRRNIWGEEHIWKIY